MNKDSGLSPISMTSLPYVHGYSDREDQRLRDQSQILAELLHQDTRYPPGSRVLEAGCGVGAQTVLLAGNSPQARFTCVDVSVESLKLAETAVRRAGISNVAFRAGDLFQLPFDADSFDHVFLCFVLEHLEDPLRALRELKRVLKPAGTLTVIEGDHGSTFFHPRSDAAWKTIQCLIDLQSAVGGDALIGRQLHPLLCHAGFANVSVSPRFVYADSSRPDWVEGFTRNTYIAMVQGIRERALEAGLIDGATWERGLADLKAAAGPEGTFCYTFFKAVAVKE